MDLFSQNAKNTGFSFIFTLLRFCSLLKKKRMLFAEHCCVLGTVLKANTKSCCDFHVTYKHAGREKMSHFEELKNWGFVIFLPMHNFF